MPDPRTIWKVSVDKDGALKSFSAIEDSIAKMAKQQQTAFKAFKSSMTEINSAIGIGRQAIQALGAAIDLVIEGEKVSNYANAFFGISTAAKEAYDTIKANSFGLLAETDILKAAQAYERSGAELKDFKELSELAFKTSLANMAEYDAVLKDVTKSLKDGNAAGLEQYGITVDLSKAFNKYAESIGVSVEALTQEQKATAATAAIAAEMNAEFGKVDLANANTEMQKLTKAWDSLRQTLLALMVSTLEPMLKKMEAMGLVKKEWSPEELSAQVIKNYGQTTVGDLQKKGVSIQQVKDAQKAVASGMSAVDALNQYIYKTQESVVEVAAVMPFGSLKEADEAMSTWEAGKAKIGMGKPKEDPLAKVHAEMEAYSEAILEGERQKGEDKLAADAEMQMLELQGIRDFEDAKLQILSDARDQETAINAELWAAKEAEIQTWITYASTLDAVAGSVQGAIAAVTGSKKAEVAAIIATSAIKAIYEGAESIGSFALGNIPAGIAHAAAAVQYGIVAGSNIANFGALTKGTTTPKKDQGTPSGMGTGKASLSSQGTTPQAVAPVYVIFNGDVVGPSGNKQWLFDEINKGVRNGSRFSSKAIGTSGAGL